MRKFRRQRHRGVALVWAILIIFLAIAWLSLGLDYGGVAMTAKIQAITASENASISALSEVYPPDYAPLGLTMASDWPNLVLQIQSRDEAATIAGGHLVGQTKPLFNRFNNPVLPTDNDYKVHFGPSVDYNPNVQPNIVNDPDGDVLLGRWEDSGSGLQFTPVLGFGQPGQPGDPNREQFLPLGMTTVIRRTHQDVVPGISEGGNPIPRFFSRALYVSEINTTTNAVTPFGVYRNRGIQILVGNIVAPVPMASIGAGTELPLAGGGTTRTGVMPVALVWESGNEVDSWLIAGQSNPDLDLIVDIDNMTAFDGTNAPDATAEGFLTGYGLDPIAGTFDPNDSVEEMVNFLEVLPGNQLPPSALTLNDIVNRHSDLSDAFSNRIQSLLIQLAGSATDETWTVPVLRAPTGGDPVFRVAGFLRVYCVSVTPGPLAPPAESARQLTLRLAPTAVARNGRALREPIATIQPDVQSLFYDELWRTTTGGDPYGPIPFGVSCAAVTVQYDNMQR